MSAHVITPDTPWRDLPDIGPERFASLLAGTPLAAEAGAISDALGDLRTIGILILWREQGRAGANDFARQSHNPWLLRRWHPTLDTRPVLRHPRDGDFLVFPSYPDAAAELRYRLANPAYKPTDPGVYARTVTLLDLNRAYAPAGDGANDPEARTRAMVADANDLLGGRMGQRIVVVAGHRSYNDPGNPDEKARTPALARAYRDALRAAGHQVWWLQEHDGDSDPDDTVGGLDTVGQRTRDLCAKVDADVMLDLHFEGASPHVRGCFAIVPDSTGLTTAVPGGAPADDTLANNTRDRSLARALARRIEERTGLPRRTGLIEPGVMGERQTGVGLQGFRLAMFAYTAGRRSQMVRLVVEHGALTNAQDRAIIDQPWFAQACGAAAALAIADVYGASAPGTTPAPQKFASWWKPETVPGLDLEIARGLFGTVRIGNVDAPFDPTGDGVLSRLWFEEGARTGYWPSYGGPDEWTGVLRRFGTGDNVREYVRSRGGRVDWRPNQREPFRVMKAK